MEFLGGVQSKIMPNFDHTGNSNCETQKLCTCLKYYFYQFFHMKHAK